nr:hypothetical protein [Tanacetum cinerariifolium]
MSDASSIVTYTSVYTDSEPWRYYGEDSTETGPPRVFPLPADASPIAASPDYVADSDPEEDPKEDPEDDQADYPADGGDGDDEPSDDDNDDDDINDEDPEEEPFEEDDEEEEEEHSTLADSPPVPIVDLTVRPEPLMSSSMEACIARLAALLSPSLLVPSLPLPLPSPLTTSPTDTRVPLGYRAAGIRIRALLPSTSHRTDILEADMPPRKKACLTTLVPEFKIEESSVAVDKMMEIAPTTLDGVNERVRELDTIVKQRTDEFEMDMSSAITTHVITLKTQVAALITQTMSLQTQLTTTLGRIKVLEARDLEPQEGPAEAGSS